MHAIIFPRGRQESKMAPPSRCAFSSGSAFALFRDLSGGSISPQFRPTPTTFRWRRLPRGEPESPGTRRPVSGLWTCSTSSQDAPEPHSTHRRGSPPGGDAAPRLGLPQLPQGFPTYSVQLKKQLNFTNRPLRAPRTD